MNSLAYKAIITIWLSTVALIANPIDIIKQYSKSGQAFIRLANNTNNVVYCTIIGVDSRYFKDFYIKRRSLGRWYIEPLGQYYWNCK